jgi:ornithine cyclodeaminase/alanine dehydrogenase-like protein (mu-crystallin family)
MSGWLSYDVANSTSLGDRRVDEVNRCPSRSNAPRQKRHAFSREQLHAELGEVLSGRRSGRDTADEIIVLNPMGMAVEDIAFAAEVYMRARRQQIGTWLNLY